MRQNITAGQYESARFSATQLLITHPLFLKSQHVACYFGQDDEFDCASIIQEVWSAGKTCYLPVLSLHKPNYLEFVVYHAGSPLRLNRYHIFEPETGDRIAAENLDLVIVPLLAFDRLGHRIGMGGGYYDRTFAFKQKHKGKPYLLGLGYGFQEIDAVPNEVWDLVLDGLLTEEKLLFF